MKHALQCRCGAVKGTLEQGARTNRVICYCRDCQAFAHYLQGADHILDEHGGTNVFQVSPYRLLFAEGIEQLRCVQLTEGGMYRWYSHCCKTPIGNTLANFKWSFIGMTHSIIKLPANTSLDQHAGPVRKHVNIRSAKGDLDAEASHPVLGFANIFAQMLRLRVTGRYRQTPFFDTHGKALVEPRVLDENTRKALYASF